MVKLIAQTKKVISNKNAGYNAKLALVLCKF